MHLQRAGVATILTRGGGGGGAGGGAGGGEGVEPAESLLLSQWRTQPVEACVCVGLLSSALPIHQQLKSEQEKTFASFLKEVLPLVSSLLSLCD